MNDELIMRTTLFETSEEALAIPVGDVLPAHRNPGAVYVLSLAPGSRRTMAGALSTMASLMAPGADVLTFPWHRLDYSHTAVIRSRIAERFAASTCNRYLAALRGTLKTAWRLGLMDAERMARASDVKRVAGSRLPTGRSLSQGDLRALFEICDVTVPAGARDAALLAIAYGSGLRRAELVALDLDAFDPATGALKILGKGNKERIAYVTGGARAALDAWLRHRGAEPGPLLYPVQKGAKMESRRMSGQAIYGRVQSFARRARIAGFSPHDLRRSFVSDLLEAGADIATVQAMSGHASPVTTARYDRRDDRAKEKASGMLHVPFVGATS